MVAMMDGRMRGGGSGVSSWLVTVIIVLALLQLHLMVGVDAGRQMPRQLLHESCLKDLASLNILNLLLNSMPSTPSADVMAIIRHVVEDHNISLEHGRGDHDISIFMFFESTIYGFNSVLLILTILACCLQLLLENPAYPQIVES